MAKLPDNQAPADSAAAKDLAGAVTRARWLMLISLVTTAIAVAAVAGVIGYRLFANGNESENLAGSIVNGTIFVPQGAHVVSTTISNGRVFVTLDIGGADEVRIFDLKTLQQVGDLRFATQH
jgi:hypothetical protein